MVNGAYHDPPRLERVIAWRLAEHAYRLSRPMPEEQLRLWIRLQWPRILPEAIGTTLCSLAAVGLVESDELGWSIRSPASRTKAARAHWNGWDPQQGRPV